MLSKSDSEVNEAKKVIEGFGLRAEFLVPTETGLSKSLMDATSPLADLLAAENFHNYRTQQKGQESKVKKAAILLSPSGSEVQKVSLYRPETKNGDPRIWISGLSGFASPWNLLALFVKDDRLCVLNCSRLRGASDISQAVGQLGIPIETENDATPAPTGAIAPKRNARVLNLLEWHGHEKGGVCVPFQHGSGNPLGDTIETNLLARLRKTAKGIAAGEHVPRVIFLVGGPGNGKSEAVQIFLEQLGEEFGCRETLSSILTERFKPNPVSPPRIDISQSDLTNLPRRFGEMVGRLTIVQDASASGRADGDAAFELVGMLSELLLSTENRTFICCANRGLLFRAIEAADQDAGREAVAKLLVEISSRTGLGLDALRDTRPACWPMEDVEFSDYPVGAWPLDLESLMERNNDQSGPFEQIVSTAVAAKDWNEGESCPNCSSSSFCPFLQNAKWLQSERERESMLRILRHGELATGQRWNFRDGFSLVAELIVGEQRDYSSGSRNQSHPCDWVHNQVSHICSWTAVNDCEQEAEAAALAQNAAKAAVRLSGRLYPHALFQVEDEYAGRLSLLCEQSALSSNASDSGSRPVSSAFADSLSDISGPASSFAKRYLRSNLTPILSPELRQPGGRDSVFRNIEDAFAQSVQLGRHPPSWPQDVNPSGAEEVLLQLIEIAEDEWDLQSRESARAEEALCTIRKTAAHYAKRAIGVRLGLHAEDDLLSEYKLALRSDERLGDLENELEELLGTNLFRVNALGGFGMPEIEGMARIELVSKNGLKIEVEPAPSGTWSNPPHDLPRVKIAAGQHMPLTFEIFRAVRLRKNGCRSGSLPPALSTSLGSIRQIASGALGRETRSFKRRKTWYQIGNFGSVRLSGEDSHAVFEAESNG